MARKTRVPDDDLLTAMRRAIMSVLDNPKAEIADRMKAIEAGAKILAMEHKIRDKGGAKYGSFFSAGSEDE